MSRKRVAAGAVIEWSPSGVSWVDSNHQLRTAESFLEAVAVSPGRDVLIAVSRRTTFIRAYRVPNAGKAEVMRILANQIGLLFPVPSNELAFDVHLTQDVNSEGRLAIVAAMRSSDLHALHSQAKAANLRVVQVVPTSLGSALIAKEAALENCAVVHKTAEGLAVDLVVDGELRYSRVATMPPTSIGIDAEVSRTFAAAILNCSPTIAAGALAIADAEVSTDTWALEALLGHPTDINIQTPEQVAQAERRAQAQRMRLSLMLLTASLLMAYGVYDRYSTQLGKYRKADSKWTVELSKWRKIRDFEKAKKTTSETLKSLLDRGFAPAQAFSDVFALASNSAPAGIWLTSISLERGKLLTIRGTATKGEAVTNYQSALVAESRLRNLQLVFANNAEIENNPVVQFSFTAFPVGNLPLYDPKKKGAKK
jgi:hypothetical protein